MALLFSLIERHLHSSPWERNCLYPLCFLFLLAVTLLTLGLVAINVLSLVICPAEQLSVQVKLYGAYRHVLDKVADREVVFLGDIDVVTNIITNHLLTALLQ